MSATVIASSGAIIATTSMMNTGAIQPSDILTFVFKCSIVLGYIGAILGFILAKRNPNKYSLGDTKWDATKQEYVADLAGLVLSTIVGLFLGLLIPIIIFLVIGSFVFLLS